MRTYSRPATPERHMELINDTVKTGDFPRVKRNWEGGGMPEPFSPLYCVTGGVGAGEWNDPSDSAVLLTCGLNSRSSRDEGCSLIKTRQASLEVLAAAGGGGRGFARGGLSLMTGTQHQKDSSKCCTGGKARCCTNPDVDQIAGHSSGAPPLLDRFGEDGGRHRFAHSRERPQEVSDVRFFVKGVLNGALWLVQEQLCQLLRVL
mmetsp:Transcript_22968/g.63760  ORF Transcript_22968/g.63760 Transcript_22968/m.63760 type:complete len:204 (-) Transcript_22968:1198-1809(-)